MKHMRAYLKQHNGKFILGSKCDVCCVDDKPDNYGLLEFLIRDDTGEYSYEFPNLCPDHGRELGVVW
jgi:hypothetical protein